MRSAPLTDTRQLPLSTRTHRAPTSLTGVPNGTAPTGALTPGDAHGRLELLATLRAAGAARRHVHDLLSAGGWNADDLDRAVLLTSELVTNAVQHGAAPIVLQVEHRAAGLRVEVRDAADVFGPLPPRGQDVTAESGRGLALVDALATCWGCAVHTDRPTGKTVWFEIVGGTSPAAADA